MPRLSCRDYGFECEYVVDIKDSSEALENFGRHTYDEHGIEYSKEALMQFIIRKENSSKFEDLYMAAV
jgi:predicted small metal-binding protein